MWHVDAAVCISMPRMQSSGAQLLHGWAECESWHSLHLSCDMPALSAPLQVCEHIVLPNLGLTKDLVELFEMNWVEYVRRGHRGL